MQKVLRVALLSILGLSLPCIAQTPRPAASNVVIDRAALEVRANQEFTGQQYTNALPMLKKLAEMTKDDPKALEQIQEKIRVCERNIAANKGSPTTNPGIAAPRKPHPAPVAGQVTEMAIKDLGNFDFDQDKGSPIPTDVLALTGSKIRLRGYMIPMDQASNITQFALVADLFSCCFGQPPQLQHTVIANCPKGKAVSYYPDEITVEGTLKVGEKKDEGFIVSIFELDVSSVKPSPK